MKMLTFRFNSVKDFWTYVTLWVALPLIALILVANAVSKDKMWPRIIRPNDDAVNGNKYYCQV